ncbi:hypothetical protein OK015_20370 [Mycobacterium sp. Aquia_216]|uniref:hypothetical protein n=1 Tax=Mycobacterium sp. Aquia_216 TaxID=2991729 RepID=UPI00227B710B|nr:hypothetical protein [Mycobacterium sp. Aquia_216]WAJ43540.1 hypothetical protein OK015_20370 [Mycobacterium sp. Aquia_216]
MGADAWAAWGIWVTAGIAAVAAYLALRQLREMRLTRERVAQPNVVVYADLNHQDWHYLDFVVKNFGETPAYGIRLTLPPLDVVPWDNLATGDRVTSLYLPESIVVLAPGQEWRTMWESGIALDEYEKERKLAQQAPQLNRPVLPELRSVFVGRVEYQDKDDRPHRNPVYLDTKTFQNVTRIKAREEG